MNCSIICYFLILFFIFDSNNAFSQTAEDSIFIYSFNSVECGSYTTKSIYPVELETMYITTDTVTENVIHELYEFEYCASRKAGYESNEEKLNLYPNPNTGQFYMTYYSEHKQRATICISNSRAQIVDIINLTLEKSMNNRNFNFAYLAAGEYLFMLKSEEGTLSKKFVKLD